MKRVAGKSSPLKISKTSIFTFFPAWFDTIFIILSGACGPSALFHGLRSRCSGRIRSLLQSDARWNYILHMQVDFISSRILECVLLCKTFVLFLLWAKLFSPQTFEIYQFPLVSWNKQQKVRRHTATVSSGLISYKCTQFLMLLHAILLESIQYRFPGHAATLHQMTPRLFFYTIVSIAAAVHNGSGSSPQFWFCQLLHFC